jgi:hypothetical protein
LKLKINYQYDQDNFLEFEISDCEDFYLSSTAKDLVGSVLECIKDARAKERHDESKVGPLTSPGYIPDC